MLYPVYIHKSNLLTPLAEGTEANFNEILAGHSSIISYQFNDSPLPPYYLSKFKEYPIQESKERVKTTILENLILRCAQPLMSGFSPHDRHKTALIIASTKGNIDQVKRKNPTRIKLGEMGGVLGEALGIPSTPYIVSNACASGVSALLYAKLLLESGKHDHAIICAGDILTDFVVSGFHAFQAISEGACKPFDRDRSGMTPGEGVGALVMSTSPLKNGRSIKLLGGGQSNDANHISGPSRNGDGLYRAIQKALQQASVTPDKVDIVDAHGTGTAYNDEMESIAFNRVGFSNTPLHSLKGYFGHCFGAAGLIESILTIEEIRRDTILKNKGYSHPGTSEELNVTTENLMNREVNTALKTSSGFGGCNAAIIFSEV